MPVVVRSGSLPSLGRCDGGRCPWAIFASVGPEDRRRRPEGLGGAVAAEEESPQELRDGRDAFSERSASLGSLPVKRRAVPVAMSSGPPMSPSQHAPCGTSCERYIR